MEIERRETGRERAEKGQSEEKRGPGAGPPSLLLREGGSSESIRTVSPADTHPPATPPSRPPLVLPFIASFVAPLQADLPPSALLLSFLPFFLLLPRGGTVGGSTPERERPSLFLSYPPPRPPLSPPASPFVSSIHRGRSYDLHPSCLAELPLSLPLTLSCPLPSLTDVRARPFGNESRFQWCLSTSSYSYRPSLLYPSVSPIRRPSSTLPRIPAPFLRDISAVFYRLRSPGRAPVANCREETNLS